MVMQPNAIVKLQAPVRIDTAPEKRVELHLHTNMSSMDALTSVFPKAGPDRNVIKRAESWGHKAIAITDHGGAQSFPNAMHSAKNIKILYGCEGYYVNDGDDRIAVHGSLTQASTTSMSPLTSRRRVYLLSTTRSSRSARRS